MQPVTGTYFDGVSAARMRVSVWLDESTGYLSFQQGGAGSPVHWRLEDLRLLGDQPASGGLTITRFVADGDETLNHAARLMIKDGAFNAKLRASAPSLHKRDVPAGTGWRVTKWVTMALGALALMLFVILPALADRLAVLLPREREVSFGKAVVSQISLYLGQGFEDDITCRSPAGLDALAKMEERLTGQLDMDYDLEIRVFDHEMINAFAAPGGQVVLMRGLIDEAGSAEAVAAVLAHEIGHVEHRDSTRAALRAAGSAGLVSLVLGDFGGGALAVLLAEQMLNTSYTRASESEADDFALHALGAADVSSEGMASFFDSLLELEGGSADIPEIFLSHPPSKTRAEKARAFARSQEQTNPVLSTADWAALKSICNSP